MISSTPKAHSAQLITPRLPQSQRGKPRRGVFMLELILILPIILLVLTILYQVSVMMTTYQTLRMACFNATSVCTKSANLDETTFLNEIGNTIKDSIQGYYFDQVSITPALSTTEWETQDSINVSQIKYRILKRDGNSWQYLSAPPAPGDVFALEIKLEIKNHDSDVTITDETEGQTQARLYAESKIKKYWLLRHFANDQTDEDRPTKKGNHMTITQISAR
ncbi:MAG: hypothetical protein Q4C70_13595 [Planctomycetia bacterium]|nr:hypothetical protein [Planctomycetia bacterium]